uniref:BZIP domain-containing protein n=1 Tax=Caenorhabditis japonica TaxID=281687 RepID=A0A8R1DID9_CAEJA
MLSKLSYSGENKSYDVEPLKAPQVTRLQGMSVRGLTDLPNNGASTSAAGFIRQDSLALAATYQQRDRERYPGDFMERELDLDDYLACLTDLDVPADNVDFDDAELQKVNILYDGERPYEQPELNGYERHVAYGPGYRTPGDYDPDVYKMNCEVKTEDSEYDNGVKTRRAIKRPAIQLDMYENEYSEESTEISDDSASVDDAYCAPKSKKSKATALTNYKPSTKARKYNLKAEDEKAEPTYKLKRARNNDAVRKSRNKAKELQQQKEKDHDKMKKRIAELEGQLASEKEARARDRELLEQLLRSKNKPGTSRNVLETFNK